MSDIKYIQSDLFAQDYENTIIAHVCNDCGGWGAGFVIPLANKYPMAKEEYRKWFEVEGGNFGLGQTQIVTVDDDNGVHVANMIAQTLGGSRPLYYNHLASCMDLVYQHARVMCCDKIVAPLFGSELAGGNPFFIKELIKDCWIKQGMDVSIYYLSKDTELVEQLKKV